MATDQQTKNKAALQSFLDVVNTGDLRLISRTIDQVVERDPIIRTPLPGAPVGRRH